MGGAGVVAGVGMRLRGGGGSVVDIVPLTVGDIMAERGGLVKGGHRVEVRS